MQFGSKVLRHTYSWILTQEEGYNMPTENESSTKMIVEELHLPKSLRDRLLNEITKPQIKGHVGGHADGGSPHYDVYFDR